MRYQSAPIVQEERQETTRERAARQQRERQEELRYTASDESRWAHNRERVLANRNSIVSWAEEKGLSEVNNSKDAYTWSLEENMLLHTKNDMPSKKLVISAHGAYNEPNKTIFPIPSNVTLTFLGPHRKTLRDPSLANAFSDSRRYASVSTQGIIPFTVYAQQFLDKGKIKEITGSRHSGMVANYNLYAYAHDSIEKTQAAISGNKDLRKLYSGLTSAQRKLCPKPPESHDILTLKEGSSSTLQDILAALNNHHIKYDEIKMLFCRGKQSFNFVPNTIYPRAKTHDTTQNVKNSINTYTR